MVRLVSSCECLACLCQVWESLSVFALLFRLDLCDRGWNPWLRPIVCLHSLVFLTLRGSLLHSVPEVHHFRLKIVRRLVVDRRFTEVLNGVESLLVDCWGRSGVRTKSSDLSLILGYLSLFLLTDSPGVDHARKLVDLSQSWDSIDRRLLGLMTVVRLPSRHDIRLPYRARQALRFSKLLLLHRVSCCSLVEDRE